MTNSQQNRRKFTRYAVKVPARISSIGASPDPQDGSPSYQFSDEVCSDVSLGGAFIQMDQPLGLGERILVELHLPTERPMETIGRVTRSKIAKSSTETGIAVEFEDPDPEQCSALAKFLTPRPGETIPTVDFTDLLD